MSLNSVLNRPILSNSIFAELYFNDALALFQATNCKFRNKSLKVKHNHNYDSTTRNDMNLVKQFPFMIKLFDENYINEAIYNNLCMVAVCASPQSLKYINAQTEEICYAAINRKPYTLKYVKNQTKFLISIALCKYHHAYKYVKNKSNEFVLELMDYNPSIIRYVKSPSDEMIIKFLCMLPKEHNVASSRITPEIMFKVILSQEKYPEKKLVYTRNMHEKIRIKELSSSHEKVMGLLYTIDKRAFDQHTN